MFLLSPEGAYEHAETGLLEYVDVVVVGVAHGPAAAVPLPLVHLRREDEPAVAVRPFRPAVQAAGYLEIQHISVHFSCGTASPPDK